MRQEQMKGVFVALVTPFDDQGRISPERLGPHMEACLAEGVHGFWINGFSGLAVYLDVSERKTLAEYVVAKVAGRVPAWIHVGAMNTRDSCELAEHAAGLGATGVSVVPPLVYSTNLELIIDHMTQIQKAANLPLTYYHVPAITKVSLDVDQLTAICQRVPNLAGIKYSAMDIFTVVVLRERIPQVRIMTGFEEILLGGLMLECFDGTVGAGQNFLAGPLVDVYNNYARGHLVQARHIHRCIARLMEIQGQFDFTAATYAFLNLLGFDVGSPRRPMIFLNTAECQIVRKRCLKVITSAPFDERRLIRTDDFLRLG